jgi:hypothetical protein
MLYIQHAMAMASIAHNMMDAIFGEVATDTDEP